MVMRITGLGSGFDVDGTVAKLMEAERVPLDNLKSKKQTYEWQRDAYRDINLKVTEFRNTKLFNFKLESTFNQKTMTVTGNTDAVSAKSTANSTDGSLMIKVDGLAVAASKYSESAVATGTLDTTKALTSQSDNLAGTIKTSGTYKFKINGTEIVVDPTKETMNDVISKINKNTNVTAFYDSGQKVVSFIAKNTGVTNGVGANEANIKFEDTSGNFLSDILKITDSSTNRISGADAQVTINGLSTTRNSNTFTVNGIEVTLKQAGGVAATISAKPDTDKIVEAVKTFINDYNETLKTLNDKITETKNRDYKPLTDAQKEALTEKQIEQWEAKAKAGLIRNDPTLSKMISVLRSASTAIVNTGSSQYNSLASLGISTGDYSEKGKLYLMDESKLRAAIENNSEAVKSIFTGDADASGDTSKMGVGERMYANLQTTLTELTKKAGAANITYDDSTLTKQIYDTDTLIYKMQDRLTDIEDRYYRQYAAMEQALNKMNSQGNQLLSKFGS